MVPGSLGIQSPGQPLINVIYKEWSAKFLAAARAAGLQKLLPITLRQLRHGGASHELLAKARAQGEVEKRGRWTTDQAVRRYAKGGRFQEQLHPIPARVQDLARRALATVGSVFCAI